MDAVVVYEFVPTDDREAAEFEAEFHSDKERGFPPDPREERYPELHEAVSAFRSFEDAERRWVQIASRVGEDRVRLGPWVATVRLEPGQGFAYEDCDDPTGHLYVWGDPSRLVAAVIDVARLQL
jgi:hypothetical protein